VSPCHEGEADFGARFWLTGRLLRLRRGNWRHGVGDLAFQLECLNHAAKHLFIAIHYLETGEYLGEVKNGQPEDDLAKVCVNAAIVMDNQRQERARTEKGPASCQTSA
jgi:hypothetical protein